MLNRIRTNLSRLAKVSRLLAEYANDAWLFLRYNNFSPLEPRDKRLSNKTIIEAHTIEKGLALPLPRPHFGREKIRAMLAINEGWDPPEGDLSRSMLIGALRDYRSAFADVVPPDTDLAEKISELVDGSSLEEAKGGVRGINRSGLCKNEAAVEFLSSRFSARNFEQRALTDQEIEDVVQLALRAPSQCNRQSVRLHVYRERDKIAKLLELQGGGRGFIEVVPTLFVLASEITAWGGPQQRNQPYVDGGIFLNQLLLALDAYGFVSCPMNLAITNSLERAIKVVGNIPSRDRLVVMVAAGRAPSEELRAANSPRWAPHDICQIHDREE